MEIKGRYTETYYTVEDDGRGGSTTVETREPDITPMEFDSWAELAEFLRDHGLTEDNGHWFSAPDGSYTCDYATGEQCSDTLAIDTPRPDGWGITSETREQHNARLEREREEYLRDIKPIIDGTDPLTDRI